MKRHQKPYPREQIERLERGLKIALEGVDQQSITGANLIQKPSDPRNGTHIELNQAPHSMLTLK